MPICRICDPPRVSQTGLSLMLIRYAGTGAKISISVTMKGALKNLKVYWGFRTTYFIMKKIKKSGSVTYPNKNSLLSHNCQGINVPIQIGNYLNVQARLVPNSKKGLRVSKLWTGTLMFIRGSS